jgi:cytochrome c oxidase assembly protein subunit 15
VPLQSLIDRIPTPTNRWFRVLAIAAVITQGGIGVTGSVVRVTGSGLGCPDWPQCAQGSLVPVQHPELGQLHQWIEFGNRTLTGVVSTVAVLCLIAFWLATPRRNRQVWLCVVLLAGVGVQAVLGGIVVLTGLLWWLVALHFIASAALVWVAMLLVRSVAEGDEPARQAAPDGALWLIAAMGGVLAVLVVAGTLVTGAGPHAGDATTPRLDLPVETLAHLHAALLFVFLGMTAGLGFMLRFGGAPSGLWKRYVVLVATVLGQGAIGMIQFWAGVPAVLVTIHVLGALLVVGATAGVWCGARDRGPVPVAATEPFLDADREPQPA